MVDTLDTYPVTPTKNHTNVMIAEIKAGGTCYPEAANYLLGCAHEDAILVHGRPTLRVAPFIEYSHAWVEIGDEVIDPSSGFVGSKILYYAVGNIRDSDNHTYTKDTMLAYLLSYGHYGPWEGPEAVGTLL